MRKFTTASLAIGAMALVAACSNTSDDQTNLRKAGYDTIQAYNTIAPLAVAYENSSVADPAIVAKIKTDSAKATSAIVALGSDLQQTDVVSALEVSAATAAVVAVQSDLVKGN